MSDKAIKLTQAKTLYDNLRSMVAVNFDQATANEAGSYVCYQGAVYHLPDGHTAGTTWANTTKVGPTNIGGEVSTLKSAIDGIEDDVNSMKTGGESTTTDYTGTSPYKNTNLNGKVISKLVNNNVAGILMISGKNICDHNQITYSYTQPVSGNTITITSQADGSFVVDGDYVSTSSALYIPLIDYEYTIPAGTQITISQNLDISDGILFGYSNRTVQSGTSRTFSPSSDSLCNSERNFIQIVKGERHFDHVVFKCQAELASSATAWEGYNGKKIVASANDETTDVNYLCGGTMVAIWNGNASVTLRSEEFKQTGFNGYANVLLNGVKGDGTTDDTDALQIVINKFRKIYIPSGQYKLTKTITIPSNTEIMGDGESTEFICLGTSATLTAFEWSSDYGSDNYFYPYFVANEATNVIIREIYIHGNLTTEDEHIHTGLCFYESAWCVTDAVKISKVNYFPENAPSRPSGQWRRGWALSMFDCENVEVKNGDFTFSPYENVRVGKNCKNVNVHDCVLKYGWRTGLQILRGCENVFVERCEIVQDDEDTYDTRACITIHSASSAIIKNVTIRDCKMTGDLYITTDGSSGGISCVDSYCDNLVVENNIIAVTGSSKCIDASGESIRIANNKLSTTEKYGVIVNARSGANSKVEIINNTIVAVDLGVTVDGVGTKEIVIDGNTITSSNNHAIYIGGTNAFSASLIAKGNKLIAGDTSHHGIMCASSATLNGAIIGNTCGTCQYGARVLGGSGMVVVGNDFHASTSGLVVNGTGNVTGNNATP